MSVPYYKLFKSCSLVGKRFDFANVCVAKLGVLVIGEYTHFMAGDGADLYGVSVVGNEVSDLEVLFVHKSNRFNGVYVVIGCNHLISLYIII